MSKGKLIIFSAPSGSGKTTIVKHLLTQDLGLEFSISATSRNSRHNEVHGKDYYFLTPEEFKQKAEQGDFLEWEEVYAGTYYGTLKSEVERIRQTGKNVIFDVDVVGGANIKEFYGDEALAIFVQAPSIEELEKRLTNRDTDTPDVIQKRIDKAEFEMTFAPKFDCVLVNDELDNALLEAENLIRSFISQ